MTTHKPGPWHVVTYDGFYAFRSGSDNVVFAETDGQSLKTTPTPASLPQRLTCWQRVKLYSVPCMPIRPTKTGCCLIRL